MVNSTVISSVASITLKADISSEEWFIIGASIIAILFGLLNAAWILKIEIISKDEEVMALKDDRMLGKL